MEAKHYNKTTGQETIFACAEGHEELMCEIEVRLIKDIMKDHKVNKITAISIALVKILKLKNGNKKGFEETKVSGKNFNGAIYTHPGDNNTKEYAKNIWGVNSRF